ncbi:cadherin-like domain-containing protein [Trichocoleus sp. FACHB-591]|uniref:cadherin-like domain-containing protein n=1 Tax=Trichocoleus sp. FACHB-591 TaxID=2692872 RepID=UPI001686F574|nr:cadherin-like domain-containing protein [Trichocoleus sp. FACHB-591]MBD2096465.1 cadherin-like domain-containing protein [Trichocoleus sp. FACHB-591]
MTSLNEAILADSLVLAQQQLQGFAQSENFLSVLDSVFGTEYDRAQAEAIQQAWQASDFSQLPEIQVLDNASMSGVQGGFSAQTGKIYINADFLANATADQITTVLIEEIGHSLDSWINISDTLGDEGELFSAYVRGIEISEPALAAMQFENDQVEGVVDGIPLALEASSLRVGYYDMSLGSGNASQVEAIQAAGHIPILITSLSDAELASINMLVVQNPNNSGFGSEYLARLSAINLAVESGLKLIIHDRHVASAETILPGSVGFNIVRDFSDSFNINFIDDNHSVASGPGGNLNDGSLDQGNYSSHGFALSGTLPVDADLILSQGDASKIVTFSYRHGNGHVIYSSIPLDVYLGDVIGNGGTGGIYRNAEEYAANLIDYAAVDLGNKAPTGSATASLVAGTEDTAYTITKAQLLAGFSDVDGNALSITDFATSNGSFVENEDGSFTITGANNYNGSVTVSYKVSDGSLSVDASNSFTLAAVNDAATLTGTKASLAAGSEDTVYTISQTDLLTGFSDVEGDILSVSNLTASNGSLVNNSNGTWSFTPAANYNGAVNLSYNVTDGQGGSTEATQSFTLAAVNDAATLTGTKAILSAGSEDTVYTISQTDLLTGFSDVEGDSLSVSNLTASNGTLVNNNNGTWSFTPTANYNGTVNLSYNVTDGQGGSTEATQSFTLAAVNDTPTATNESLTTAEDVPLVISAASLLGNDADVDLGDSLSVSAVTQPGKGGLVDNGNGTYTYTPNTNYNDTDSFTYTISDREGATSTATVNLTVNAVNDNPDAINDIITARQGTAKTILAADLLANDADIEGDALRLTQVKNAQNGTVALDSNGNVVFTANANVATASFEYTLSDGQGGTDIAFVSVLVGVVDDGGNGQDTMNGTAGDDVLNGGNGDDILRGFAGDDKLLGGNGIDNLQGGEGKDWLYGGRGNDLLNGGLGRDTFVLISQNGTDTIQDFTDGEDQIGLAEGLTFGQLTVSSSNGNTLIAKNGGDVLAILSGVNSSLITQADFISVV